MAQYIILKNITLYKHFFSPLKKELKKKEWGNKLLTTIYCYCTIGFVCFLDMLYSTPFFTIWPFDLKYHNPFFIFSPQNILIKQMSIDQSQSPEVFALLHCWIVINLVYVGHIDKNPHSELWRFFQRLRQEVFHRWTTFYQVVGQFSLILDL